ncbi:MAG: integrase family protein [Candidatus Thiodiazotropha lotti]|nr:integrase family protein [Candidatus Thiodiazotropha lotti]
MTIQKGRKKDGRTMNLSCRWFTRLYGEKWEPWRAYAEEWLHEQERALGNRRDSMNHFLESYLVGENLPCEPRELYARRSNLPNLLTCIEKRVRATPAKSVRNNYIVDFIDWVIEKDFTQTNDTGDPIQLVTNPFDKVKQYKKTIESVCNPLPYTYIREIRAILCPDFQGHFRDWTWAQSKKNTGSQIDWFEIDQNEIDRSDPDCVWRERMINRNQRKVSVTELWSPVRAMVLFIKLHLPLRTYQVRMLDSGEADSYRFEHGRWVNNKRHRFSLGSEKAPWQRGIFRRIQVPDTGDVMAGLYINTNKTADQNKEDVEQGYVIPWQHDEVLYWLEKLRNWQEKYNPISKPTSWTSLQTKHIGSTKSEVQLIRMGESCFLFRDASAKNLLDRSKPILRGKPINLWYRLLNALEDRVVLRGQTLSDGSRLRFVKDYPDDHTSHKVATEFPLHSLRVSLITCYAMDGQVPLPVLSKLLAGHSRIMMTLYYTKITPAVMREKMNKAQSKIDAREKASLRSFLEDADLRHIKDNTVYRDASSIESALVNRNPVGWEHRHIGLCLVGGHTARSNENATLGGCWNGGNLIKGKKETYRYSYDSVPHGPQNCVRCRWFLTDARYLDALRAHFNNLSYHASQAAALSVNMEQTVEGHQDARYIAEQDGKPFTQQAELQEAERRYEIQKVEADEYAKDMRACFTLIHRIIAIETNRDNDDNHQKLIAAGTLSDVNQPFSLLETNSELWQLTEICEDAEVYPDLADRTRKTPAIEKRSRALNKILMRENYSPVFMQMDDQMQLIMGNAMMRAMAQRACPDDWRFEGYRLVTGLIETEQSLSEYGLLESGIKALEHQWDQPILSLNELLCSGRRPQLEIARDDD